MVVCLALIGCAVAAGAGPDLFAACMPAPSERTVAFRNTVVLNLGAGAVADVRWNTRTTVPTLSTFAPLRALAARRGWDIDAWFFDDGACTALEAAEGRWRPAIAALAFAPGVVSSIGASVAAFNAEVRPGERARSTRLKYLAHRLSILTWAVWKGCLPQLLPMSDDLLRAYIWDSLAFETSLSVLKHAVGAVKAWHQRLGMAAPMDGPGDFRRLTTSLARFQPCPRLLKFPIYAGAVQRLLLLPFPAHPPCSGVIPPKPRGKWTRCEKCWVFLLCWFDCLTGATGTIICSRCKELGLMTVCDIWWRFDELAGFLQFAGGAAFNIGIRKNDQFRCGHQARVGVPKDPRLDLLAQLREALRLLGTLGPHPGCVKSKAAGRAANHTVRCNVCPPVFPRRIKKGQEFDLSRPATSAEVSASIIRGMQHVGFDTTYYSGISARKGGLSTAIEAGVPEHILWMQSGHAQDVAARRYVQLNSPALLYRTYESFGL